MDLAFSARGWFKLPVQFFMTLWAPAREPRAALLSRLQTKGIDICQARPKHSVPPLPSENGRSSAIAPFHRPAPRMVRVIQVLDSSQPHGESGRIRISGTMEEVCAELDRLVRQSGKSPSRICPLH